MLNLIIRKVYWEKKFVSSIPSQSLVIIAASLSARFQNSCSGGEVMDIFLETTPQTMLVGKEKPASGLRNLIDDPVMLRLTQDEKA